MPNGQYIINDLKFNDMIKGMGDRELLEFTVRLSLLHIRVVRI